MGMAAGAGMAGTKGGGVGVGVGVGMGASTGTGTGTSTGTVEIAGRQPSIERAVSPEIQGAQDTLAHLEAQPKLVSP